MSSKNSGWGNYPSIDYGNIIHFDTPHTLAKLIKDKQNIIPQGNRRSYGDSALAKNMIANKTHCYFLDFNNQTGLLWCQSGVLLSDILDVFIPKGWFLSVTPGTKLITIAGAIASDVHGKNHHIAGCFSEFVVEFNLLLPNGEVVTCSKDNHSELFLATCGGMGLTGVILDAKILLKKINSSQIKQTTIKTKNLTQTFSAFESNQDKTYSVAWIDCLAKGDKLGRSILTIGEFANNDNLTYKPKKSNTIKFNFPSWVLNKVNIRLFNFLYYHKQKSGKQTVSIDKFFYPLDAIKNWNKIYGKQGFVQYQFILPKENSLAGLGDILNHITNTGMASFLAVLKLYGKANNNYLSFPLEGYSLALDFKMQTGLLDLLDELDELVIKYHGRIYLAKDARIKQAVFAQGYPNIEKFKNLRKQYKMDEKFNSLQSQRINI